jgi:hypothetical protein
VRHTETYSETDENTMWEEIWVKEETLGGTQASCAVATVPFGAINSCTSDVRCGWDCWQGSGCSDDSQVWLRVTVLFMKHAMDVTHADQFGRSAILTLF